MRSLPIQLASNNKARYKAIMGIRRSNSEAQPTLGLAGQTHEEVNLHIANQIILHNNNCRQTGASKYLYTAVHHLSSGLALSRQCNSRDLLSSHDLKAKGSGGFNRLISFV